MVLTFNYNEPIKHKNKWFLGYNIECKKSYKKYNDGPKNGTIIKIRNLPRDQNVYLRFWAAKQNNKNSIWSNVNEAYDNKSKYESEPEIEYFNGGMIRVSNKGLATFRLILPSSYKYNNTIIKPHFHYRLCINNKMTKVITQYINTENINEGLYLYNKI